MHDNEFPKDWEAALVDLDKYGVPCCKHATTVEGSVGNPDRERDVVPSPNASDNCDYGGTLCADAVSGRGRKSPTMDHIHPIRR